MYCATLSLDHGEAVHSCLIYPVLPTTMANGGLPSPGASSIRFPDLLPLCRLLCAYI